MKPLIFLLLLLYPFIIKSELNQVDQCLSKMKKLIKGRSNITKTLGGMVGVGWNDLSNEYTLPVFKETYYKCLTDHNNQFLIPDSIVLIPIKHTDLDRTSSTFDSYDEYMEKNSNKLTVTGSLSGGGKSASASFSKEHEDTKKEFVKQNSMMLQNKLVYEAYQLIANDNGEYEEAFINRVKEIAAAIKEKNELKANFFAEQLIGDYGTHVVNKATAAAEIEQQYFIEKIEKFKGQSHMDKIAVGASAEFENASGGGSGSVSYESSKSESNNETETNTSMKSIIKTKGGPSINRIGSTNPNTSMLYVDNLIGTKQSGKFLYDVIPGLKLPEYSDYVKFGVRKLIYDATQKYYKFNYLPGCTDMESENYNFLANDNDGSCDDPKELYNFGGVFQTCIPLQSLAQHLEDIPFGEQCKKYEQKNRITRNFSCPPGMIKTKIHSLKIEFVDRIISFERSVCYGPRFLHLCRYEIVNETAYDEIFVQSYWCGKTIQAPIKQKVKREKNDLDIIMRNDILTTIDKFPQILQLFFNQSYGIKDRMVAEEKVCEVKDGDDSGEKENWKTFQESIIEQAGSQFCSSCDLKKLNLASDQLETLFIYPNVIEALLHIIDLPEDIENLEELFKSAAENPVVLKQVLFNQSKSLHPLDSEIKTAFFGGAFQGSNLNPFTGRPNCPPNFLKAKILTDFYICVSHDQELLWPIRFGGFHHCESEVKKCPRGYSQYLGAIQNECEYYYCIRFATRHTFPPPVVNKPPYLSYEIALAETTKKSS